MPKHIPEDPADLFRHVSAEKAAFYRCIMDVFAAAKRQYRLQLRPDEDGEGCPRILGRRVDDGHAAT